MGPSQICGCPFREPRVFTIAHIINYTYYIILWSTWGGTKFMLLDSFAKQPNLGQMRITFPSPLQLWQLWDGPQYHPLLNLSDFKLLEGGNMWKCDLATTLRRKLNRRNFCPNSNLMYVVINVWYGMRWYGTVCMLLHVMHVLHVVHGLYDMHSLHVMHVMHIMHVMYAMYVMYVLCVVCVTYVVDVTHCYAWTYAM